MNYSFILLSAGKSTRFGNVIPKQYLLLAGKPILVHSLERIDTIEEICEIILVCSDKYIPVIQTYLKQYKIQKKVIFVNGGKTRQESVFNGLQVATQDQVIIHEAARPFVSVPDFKELIACSSENVTYTLSIPYTVLKKNEKNIISDVLNRGDLVNIQLPQKFSKKDLIECHNLAIQENKQFTEDAGMIYYYLKKPVYCLTGKSYNIKITEYIDSLFGEIIYQEDLMGEIRNADMHHNRG